MSPAAVRTPSHPRDPQVTRAIQFLFGHYREPIGLADIVAATGVSKSSLYTVFQDDLGKTPIDVLTYIRLSKAKHVLRETNQKVHAIAADCGFGLVANLYHNFKQNTGMTPAAYRQQSRAWRRQARSCSHGIETARPSPDGYRSSHPS